MKILIDTHYLIWALNDAPKLTENDRKILLDSNNEIFYSTISIWEIAIKSIKNKFFDGLPELIDKLAVEAGYNEIKLDKKHVFEVIKIKEIKNHKDPFDKMLLAQAQSEGLKLLTRDKKLLSYDET